MIYKRLFIIPFLLGCAFGNGAEEVTSANGGERLKSFHERFPQADLNKDKVLTVDEMHDFLDEKIKDGAQSEKTKQNASQKGGAIKNLTSRVYLSTFLEQSPDTDLDKDGILTKEELLTYIKMQKKIITDKGEIVPAPIVQSSN